MRTPAQIANQWIDAFNRHDLASLVGLYAGDAVHTSPKLRVARPETGGRIVGREDLTEWWREAFARLPSLRYELQSITADEARAFLVYVRQVDGARPLTVAECLEVRAGLIVASAVFHG